MAENKQNNVSLGGIKIELLPGNKFSPELIITGDLERDLDNLRKIAGDASDRIKIDDKGKITFDTTGLDLSKNEGTQLIKDLVTSKQTYEFSTGPKVITNKGPVEIKHTIANLPSFGDQPNVGKPRNGVDAVVALYIDNLKIERISNTKLKVAPEYTVAFHELAEAYEKIDKGNGGSYADGHNAALGREKILREQRPELQKYNTGAGGPANSPNPEGGIKVKTRY